MVRINHCPRLRVLLVAVVIAFSNCLSASKRITVAADGSGDVKTVQEAMTAVAESSPARTIIEIKPGTYSGPFIVPKNRPRITLVGDDASSTILTWDHNVRDSIPEENDRFNPGMLVLADDFQAVGLTIEN